MTITLVTDPTEVGFNSFVSLEEADEYFSGVYFGERESWDTVIEDDKARLLVTATRALSVLSWTGTAVGALAFPRTYSNTFNYEPTTPSFVKTLVCEWALWILQDSEASTEAPLEGLKIGDLDFKFGKSSVTFNGLPPSITALLAPLSPLYLVTSNRARSLSMRY